MPDFKMTLSDDVRFILGRMRERGYEAHVVGGSVRDSYLGREIGDVDIATSALPEETKAVFSDLRTVDTGIKHGTVTLVLNGAPYEITTYRVDGDYKDNRHPEEVTFASRIEDDLSRRDFTVNAMAYSDESGLVDPFGGREDARCRLIRAVGDARVRFDEDALRILRALRFASVLGFDIEDATSRAVREQAGLLVNISKERIYTELKKLIMGADALKILSSYPEVFSLILGGMTIGKTPDPLAFDGADFYTRLASVFYLNTNAPSALCESVLTDLKTDKLTRTHTTAVLSAYDSVAFDNERNILLSLYRYGRETVEGVLSLGILLGRFSSLEAERYTVTLGSGVPYTVSALAVRGGDVASLGYRGEKIGEMLEKLLLAVIDGRVENEKSALIKYLQ